ncbi:MAG: hypothetical protein COA96_08575 [SAR86 cluster bacterium]|uniref:Spermatogenesis-associated protein 20-like TRX domain-containing protein n=1 Tax=SAR86 cluster bacterium TaxID=2030880 RepID=A0A2A5B1B3_9GAMM|nr:MAG: hypothetical protein COA96_08575 [SAR86 cluster bacterium]
MKETKAQGLEIRLRKRELEKEGAYDKRTEHLDNEGKSIFINRLILEDSPYLLQHAHNPVNWYPWGDEAFADALQQDKPVFLSIGYSTCHWCHVMEVESFDNIEVAEVLNKHFICIKMDREQYPDIDEVFMTGVQIMSGHGGWPMSNFLLSDGKPFFGATYFPQSSFVTLLNQIVEAWTGKREELENSAGKISDAVSRILSGKKSAASIQPEIIEETLQSLLHREDQSFGGLAGEPKFPQEPLLLLMLDQVRRNRDLDSMGFVSRALEGMACGGIYDQVGGGFHRYSVDAQWLVPHFEKMLYNQSQLGQVYLQAYQLTGNPFFKRVCEQVLDYVLRDMQLPEGGFYSATDADSEGEEGTFFTWSIKELEQVLDVRELKFIVDLFGVSLGGNFEGSNILNLSVPLTESAAASQQDSFYADLDSALNKLYLARKQRIHPLRDDKLIVAWTAAMITTLVNAANTMDRQGWLEAATRAAKFLWLNNVTQTQQLKRIYLNGTVSIAGQLEDYANFIEALINLFDATRQLVFLQQAVQLMNTTLLEFWDEENNGFYLSPAQQSGPQLTRSRSGSDGATLSPVGVALHCMLMLNQRSSYLDKSWLQSEVDYLQKSDLCIAALSADINDNSIGHSSVLRAVMEKQQGSVSEIQYANGGKARIVAHRKNIGTSFKVEFSFNLQDSWHLIATPNADSELRPVRLIITEGEQHWQLSQCMYPNASRSLAQDNGNPISVFENDFTIVLELERTNVEEDLLSASVGISLHIQLCNDEYCLMPQLLNFRI